AGYLQAPSKRPAWLRVERVLGEHGILNDSCAEVTALAADQQRFVAPAEQMANQLMPPIKPAGVSAQKPFHARDQIGLRCFGNQIKMIPHQAKACTCQFVLAHASPSVSRNRCRS